jgi:ubiquinone/menaquinone biosynthesis C-methylase UbiE
MQEYCSIADRLASEVEGELLDWGCGFGQLTRLLRERSVRTTAFDFREDAVTPHVIALERYPDVVAHVSGDPVALPFDDNSFDAVLSCGVLEHVQDPAGSLEELRRILRPGGRLYVYKLPNRYSYLEVIARLMGLYYHGKLPHDRVYTLRSARALIERHGFTVEATRRRNLLPLTMSSRRLQGVSGLTWKVNSGLSNVPVLDFLATNLEVDAVAR